MALTSDSAYFGNYRLSARIATGGMAEVYLGRQVSLDGQLGPTVAIKRLLPHLKTDSAIVRMFLNEAEITAQIHHPNVVRILDLGQTTEEPFIAMELLDGHSFADLRTQAAQLGQRLPLGITLRILTDACRGLDAAHRAKDASGNELRIVHRDFTPDNIHVGINGEVKVIDFGIAKSATLGSGTEPGTLKGKFFYMSPEMIAGRPVDHRADLFAAGVMLYEQLCGRRPFTGLSTDEVLNRIAEGRPKRPREFDPSVPLALELICLTALSKEPTDRFPSLNEFILEIERVGGSAQVASTAEVSAYMTRLFPAEMDLKRQALFRARQADPSQPYTYAEETAGLPVPNAPRVERAVAPAAPVVSGKVAGTPRITAATPAARREPSRPFPWRIVGAVAVVLLVLGAGVVVYKLLAGGPVETATTLLSRADEESDAHRKTALLRKAADAPEATAPQLVHAGDALLKLAAPNDALAVAEKAEARFPQNEAAVLLEARAATALRLGKRAEAALDHAEQLAPEDAKPELLRAELKQMQGDASGALDALTRAAKQRPGSREIAARRGYLLSQLGQLDDAAKVLSGLLDKKWDAEAGAELAFVKMRQQQPKDALALLKRALKTDPQLAKAHYYLGAVLYQQGDASGAERAYRDADRLGPGDSRALAALCEVQAKSGAVAEASKTETELRTRFPAEANALVANCKP